MFGIRGMKPDRSDFAVSLTAGVVLFVANYLIKSLINPTPSLLYGVKHWSGGKFLGLFSLSFLIAACIRITFAFLPTTRTSGLLLMIVLFIVLPAINLVGASPDQTLRWAIWNAFAFLVALVVREITTPRPEVQALLKKRYRETTPR